jgi:hypothetical protein
MPSLQHTPYHPNGVRGVVNANEKDARTAARDRHACGVTAPRAAVNVGAREASR